MKRWRTIHGKGVIGLKRINLFFIITSLLIGIISGCQRDLPKPETKPKVVSMNPTTTIHTAVLPVYFQNSNEIPSLFVQYQARGNNVFVECIVSGISFREADRSQKKQGKMVVWIDGKRSQEASSAAFIIKGLSPGNHKLKLEVVNLNNKPYGLVKEFMVKIP